jgi:hypothetical protein
MYSPTFSTLRSTCLGDLQLPVRIITSTLVAVYFASCSIAKHEHPRMVSFSVASFSALHSSFRYLGLYTLLASIVHFLTAVIECTYHTPYLSWDLCVGVNDERVL